MQIGKMNLKWGRFPALLLAGMFLRAKVPLFRKFLVPASVIGGFLGLLLGEGYF